MSDTMTEGVVAKWHKKIGDVIKAGDLVAEIETDKATMEFESYQNGTLLYIGIPEGKGAPVDSILAIIGKDGEDYSSLLREAAKPVAAAVQSTAEKKTGPLPSSTVSDPTSVKVEPPKISKPVAPEPTLVEDRIKASPLAKKLAVEKGIDLSKLKGSGDNGRVIKRDIDWFKPSSFITAGGNAGDGLRGHFLSPGFVGEERFEEIPVSQMRKTIARRLSESKFTAPHFYLTMEMNMEKLMDARESINAVAGVKISVNDLIIKAAAASLRLHPMINASWQGDTLRINHHIHIGVAVAVDEGLLVPVVRFADGKTLSQIADEVKSLSQKAKEKKLQPQDWEGNTFTISNLGMFGIEEFTAIINTPDACILAVGGIREVALSENGMLRPGKVMKVTLSCDHRVVDGVTGAKFLQTLKGFLENPVILLGQNSI